jgi:hypothetical protein
LSPNRLPPSPPEPLTLDAAVIDPAAVHDEAAHLDPAKVKQPQAKPAKRKRQSRAKRTTAKAKVAAAAEGKANAKEFVANAAEQLSHKNREEGEAAYAAAVAHEAESFGTMPETRRLSFASPTWAASSTARSRSTARH